jgi:ribosomal protein S18 acetylase RimI-like enzyme
MMNNGTPGDQGEQVTIREFRYPADFADVYKLWAQSGPGVRLGRSDQPGEIVKKMGRDPDLFLVAQAGDQIVGTVLGGYDGRRGLVYHLAVANSYQRLGIGKTLMRALETRLRSKGCIRCYLLVTKDNPQGMRFYESSGWERMDLHIYAKNLD